MTNVGASGQVQQAEKLYTPSLDSGNAFGLMMALSLQQADVLRDVSLSRIPKTTELLGMFRKIAPLSGQISKVRDQVIADETGEANQQLAGLGSVSTGAKDSVTPSAADNDRFKEAEAWADARGIELKPMTKTITLKVKDKNGKEKTIQKTVIDTDAVTQNERKIAAYKQQLSNGTADNEIIRGKIAESPEMQQVQSAMTGAGISMELTTLSDLGPAAAKMGKLTGKLASDLRSHMQAAHLISQQFGESFQSMKTVGDQQIETAQKNQKAKTSTEDVAQTTEDRQVQLELQKQLHEQQIEERMVQLSEKVAEHQDFLEEMAQNPGLVTAQDLAKHLSSFEAFVQEWASTAEAMKPIEQAAGRIPSEQKNSPEFQQWRDELEQGLRPGDASSASSVPRPASNRIHV